MAVFEDNTISHDLTSDALFQAWVGMIHDGIAAAGLVQTADTGQIDPDTVTLPANGAIAGYEVWRFDDAAQSTDPVFIKIEYGRGSSGGRNRLTFAIGDGSNGSGTLTNACTTANAAPSLTPSGTGWIYAAFDDGAFCLLTAANATNATLMFAVVERLREWDTGDLIAGHLAARLGASASSDGGVEHARYGDDTWVENTGQGQDARIPPMRKNSSGYVEVGYHQDRYGPGGPYAPLRSFFGINGSDVAAGDSGQITVYGVQKNYKRSNVYTGGFQASGFGDSLIVRA